MNYDYAKSNLGLSNVTPLACLFLNKKNPLNYQDWTIHHQQAQSHLDSLRTVI